MCCDGQAAYHWKHLLELVCPATTKGKKAKKLNTIKAK